MPIMPPRHSCQNQQGLGVYVKDLTEEARDTGPAYERLQHVSTG